MLQWKLRTCNNHTRQKFKYAICLIHASIIISLFIVRKINRNEYASFLKYNIKSDGQQLPTLQSSLSPPNSGFDWALQLNATRSTETLPAIFQLPWWNTQEDLIFFFIITART